MFHQKPTFVSIVLVSCLTRVCCCLINPFSFLRKNLCKVFPSCWGRLSPLEGVKWSWDQQLVSMATTSSSIHPSSLFSSKRYGIIKSPLFSKFSSSVDPMTLFHFMHIKGMISEGWDGEGGGRWVQDGEHM